MKNECKKETYELFAKSRFLLDAVRDIDLDSIYKKDNRFYLKDNPEFYFKERHYGLYKDDLCIMNSIDALTTFYKLTKEEATDILAKMDQKYDPKPLPYMTEKPEVNTDSVMYLFQSFAMAQKALDKKENDKMKFNVLKFLAVALLLLVITNGFCQAVQTVGTTINKTIETTSSFSNREISNLLKNANNLSIQMPDVELPEELDSVENNLTEDISEQELTANDWIDILSQYE